MKRTLTPSLILLFVFLSLADLGLTWWLLTSNRDVYESNPVARWWLTRFGWLGLFVFKAAIVALVVGLVAVISRHRPRAARRVLGFGCSALALVALYNLYLVATVPMTPEQREAAAEQAFAGEFAAKNRWYDTEFRKGEAHNAVVEQVGQELVAGHCTLGEGVERLASTEKSRDPAWVPMLARAYPGRTPREALACILMRKVAYILREDPSTVRQTIARLTHEYQVAFGNPPLSDPQLLVHATTDQQPVQFSRRDAASDPLHTPLSQVEYLVPTQE